MGDFLKIFSALLAAFLIGYEVGKYTMANKFRKGIREMTKQLEDAALKLKKQAEEKEQ